MNKVIILFGFCTAGKSSILRGFKKRFEKDNFQIKYIDTDAKIAANYNNHIYEIYLRLFKEYETDSKKNKDANDYIAKKERKLLINLTDECSKSIMPYIIAPGPFLVTREPEWTIFYNRVKPICYYLELAAKEVYEGLRRRRDNEKFDEIKSLPSFGCWDYEAITEWKDGKYILLSPEIALKNIERNMSKPCKIFKYLSGENRTFSAIETRNENNILKDELYNSIRSVLI